MSIVYILTDYILHKPHTARAHSHSHSPSSKATSAHVRHELRVRLACEAGLADRAHGRVQDLDGRLRDADGARRARTLTDVDDLGAA